MNVPADHNPDGNDEAAVGRLLRCATLVAHTLTGAGSTADVDAATTDLLALPDTLPLRSELAASLIYAYLRTATQPRDLRRLDRLLEITDRYPPTLPEWPKIRALARMQAVARAGVEREAADPRAMLTELDGLAATLSDDPRQQVPIALVRTLAQFVRAASDGDHAALRPLPAELRRLNQLTVDTPVAPLAPMVEGFADAMAAFQRNDQHGMLRALQQTQQAAAQLGAEHHLLRDSLDGTITAMEPILSALASAGSPGEPGTVPTADQLAAVQALVDRPGITDAERALHRATAGAAGLGFGNGTDPDRIEHAVNQLRQAVSEASSDDPQRIFHLQSLGLGLLRRAELAGNGADFAESARVLGQARDLAGGPFHPMWSSVCAPLGYVLRRCGEPDRARPVELDGLRGYAWRALVQSDAAAAAVVARDAAEAAVEAARACLVDSAPSDAVRALDAGRGLALFAAAEFRDVASRLRRAGHPGLADRWQEVATADGRDAIPLDVRRAVLAALSSPDDHAVGSTPALLDPPGIPEIQSALARLDTDALVYLVPGHESVSGWAVVVPAAGPCSYIPLPDLALDDEVEVERFVVATSRRDEALARPGAAAPSGDRLRDAGPWTAEAQFHDSLDAVCSWAWRAAIGPVLERCLSGRHSSTSGRPPRVVLVPMGNLARVPWQASRRGDGRYAVELAAFSQAVSARLLCDTAARSPVPLAPAGLIVGDPDTAGAASELTAARIEAYAIQQTYYLGARYLGRRADGTPSRSGRGTDHEVRNWLATTRPGAGAMLHLACHGVVRADPEDATSYLVLADGTRLTTEDLANAMSSAPDRLLSLVVLAGCRTGVSSHGYDEAYSLGAAFLAGGVRSVLSTQWSIPDRATSVLMFLFHHYLMVERRPTWDALRQAQLWMLDPGRKVPERMPAPLRRQLATTDLTQPSNWAGFVHWGQ